MNFQKIIGMARDCVIVLAAFVAVTSASAFLLSRESGPAIIFYSSIPQEHSIYPTEPLVIETKGVILRLCNTEYHRSISERVSGTVVWRDSKPGTGAEVGPFNARYVINIAPPLTKGAYVFKSVAYPHCRGEQSSPIKLPEINLTVL